MRYCNHINHEKLRKRKICEVYLPVAMYAYNLLYTCSHDYRNVLFPGDTNIKHSSAQDYQNNTSVDNKTYDQSSIVVSSPSKVGTLLSDHVIMTK